MNKKVQIGLRLKEFAKINYGGIAGLERHLGKPAAYFQNYINGRSFLGGEILATLSELGCDLNWLLNGTNKNIINEPMEGYGMNYKTVLEENKKLQVQLNQLKIMIFDLQEENKTLKLQINDTEQVNSELLEELAELKKGLSTTNL